MASLNKKSLSLYLRNGCERQFILSLYGDPERHNLGLPPRQKARPGLGLIGAAGYEWQDLKVGELRDIFGPTNVHENPVRKGNRPTQIDLLQLLPHLQPHQFIVEAFYKADTPAFRAAIGITNLTDVSGNRVSIGELHPDIIQSLPPLCSGTWPLHAKERDPYTLRVLPNGDTVQLEPTDARLRLRVIDVKLSAEPGAHYFAEVVYYSMTLAAWLIEQGLTDQYLVVAAPAVWPGSHEASNLARQRAEWHRKAYLPAPSDMVTALEEDIEIAPFDVFAPRLRRLLSQELPLLLAYPWQDLSWHVDYRCKGCEFLGSPWFDDKGHPTQDPLHCLPTADACHHLSRVVGLSRGASEQLRNRLVPDVPALASVQAADPIFNDHQGLRAKRSVFPHRARALENNTTSIIPASGGDALMPRWPDLHMYIFLDYDLSSAITAAISLRAFWREPLPYGSQLAAQGLSWTQRTGEDEVFPIDQRTIDRERAEFLKFLRQMHKILIAVTSRDVADHQAGRRDRKTQISSYQIYLWDEAQRKHLTRLVGRHLAHILSDPDLRDLAWLFPPPELLPQAEDATRRSPITLVAPVVDNTLALPLAHHHRLLDVVENYHPADTRPLTFHPLYQEPMSDLIPGERLHEWWQRIGVWSNTQALIIETNRKKALALNLIVSRLEQDLKAVLARQAAPPIVRPPRALARVAPQSRLWYEFTRLNDALAGLDVQTIRAMPPHEREARLKSARLTQRLSGHAELQALAELNKGVPHALAPSPTLFVYQMASGSREVNMRPGDFLCALAPETHYGFLDESPYSLVKDTPLAQQLRGQKTMADAGFTGVTIEAIDRVHGFIALRAGRSCCISQLEQSTGLDFSRNVILDPIHTDFFTSKLKLTIEGIGDPPNAQRDQRAQEALGLPASMTGGTSAPSPAAEILWEGAQIYAQQGASYQPGVRQRLEAYFATTGSTLDHSQWAAWQEASTHRLSLLWGPPGTGKSRTLRAIILGIALSAVAEGKPVRLLVTANTYTAIDNVLLDLDAEFSALLPLGQYILCRVQSEWRPEQPDLDAQYPGITNLILNTLNPSAEIQALRDRLETPDGLLVIGCPPQQLHNLAVLGMSSRGRQPRQTIRPWFDHIIVDEASQMDVASSTLVFTKLMPGGSCVLAGDDLQLPPVQQAEAPTNLEHVVGSTYNYFRHHHGIPPSPLDINYRSNRTLVDFTRLAGYSPQLCSNSPDLRLQFLAPIPDQKPPAWPAELFWSTEWAKFLDPDYPAISFIYDDHSSSQVNDFEADAVAALIWLLHGSLTDHLLNERVADGSVPPPSTTAYTATNFWQRAVGVVTPHRAQMAKIVSRLQGLFHSDPLEDIRGAVDTVERFQGQQRDVIIASFGLGDPDIIRSEDEFLFNLNRFNVLTSRARAKLIVLVTRPLVEHLSNDINTLAESRLLKLFAETYCANPEPIQLGLLKGNVPESRQGVLRRR